MPSPTAWDVSIHTTQCQKKIAVGGAFNVKKNKCFIWWDNLSIFYSDWRVVGGPTDHENTDKGQCDCYFDEQSFELDIQALHFLWGLDKLVDNSSFQIARGQAPNYTLRQHATWCLYKSSLGDFLPRRKHQQNETGIRSEEKINAGCAKTNAFAFR